MNDHQRSLSLAAAALDFPLTSQEAADLARHLAGCPACALAAQRLRDDATGLAGLGRVPAPPRVREAIVRAAARQRAVGRQRAVPSGGGGMRWSLVAALIALVAVGGTFVAGAVLDRFRETRPAPTQDLRPRPTDPVTSSPPGGWHDMGIVVTVFDGRTVHLVLPAPDGGLVAIGRDQRSALPSVWVSDGGSSWTSTDQADDVFGGRVPTGGVAHDGALWVVGWDIAVAAPQRAIWSSADGVTWARAGGRGGLLGTEASGLGITAGPAGLLVWAPDGRVWTSPDGTTWARSDAGVDGVTDAAVDDAFHLAGVDGTKAFLVTSTDGVRWSAPSHVAAGAGARVGIERSADGTLLAWVGTQAYEVTTDGWRPASATPAVPAGEVVGGEHGFAVVGAPSSGGVQQAWLGDGEGVWSEERSDAATKGARTVVAVAPLGDGWYVLTQQGTTYRGWSLS